MRAVMATPADNDASPLTLLCFSESVSVTSGESLWNTATERTTADPIGRSRHGRPGANPNGRESRQPRAHRNGGESTQLMSVPR